MVTRPFVTRVSSKRAAGTPCCNFLAPPECCAENSPLGERYEKYSAGWAAKECILPLSGADCLIETQNDSQKGDFEMLVTKKMLLALILVGAVVGAGIGTVATRSTQSSTPASASYDTTAKAAPLDDTRTPEQIAANNSTQYGTTAEQNAYRQGFDAGYSACTTNATNSSRAVAYQPSYSSSRVVRRSGSRRVYYDYSNTTHGRTFWQKHRDKLTLAMGTGLGAAIGGLAGGGKGAGIGALAGLGGSALYTYKLRHRTPRY
jgi:hypothetical protein